MNFLKIFILLLLSSNLKAQSTANLNKNYINTKMPFYSIITNPDNFIPKPRRTFRDTIDRLEVKCTKTQDTTKRKKT